MSLPAPTAAPARHVRVGDVDLCVQTFGSDTDPPVLLVSGAAASMDWWDDELCGLVAAGGRHVVRYDHRDTGASTTDPPGHPSYDAGALDRDCAALVETLGLGPVHLVGLSMGGGMAQSLALTHPDRVRSLTLLATSPVGGVARDLLPGPAPALLASFDDPPPDPDWADRDAVVDWLVAGQQALAGPLGVDEHRVRVIAGRVVERSHAVASAGNHWLVLDGEPDRVEEGPPPDVHDLAVPTLVVHGSHDPLFPLAHGEALAEAIPGARLLVLEGAGHEVPPASTWEAVVAAVTEHTR